MKTLCEILGWGLFVLAMTLLLFGAIQFTVHTSYGRSTLRDFNRINNTSYTIEEWHIYEYDITKLHPFVEQED